MEKGAEDIPEDLPPKADDSVMKSEMKPKRTSQEFQK